MLRADLQRYTQFHHVTPVFDDSNLISCERVVAANLRNRNFTTRLDIKTYESEQPAANAMLSYKKCPFTSAFDDRGAKWLRAAPVKIAILPQSVFGDRSLFRAKRVAAAGCKIAFSPQFLAIQPRFVRKGCVSCRLVGTAPRLKIEIEKKKGKRRGQESKRAREQEGKRECEDVKMRRCEDMKM